MSVFRVGQKVVYVGEGVTIPPEGCILLSDPTFPKNGIVYTVRDLCSSILVDYPLIKLEEIPDERVEFTWDGVRYLSPIAFSAHNFRPVVTRKTDISCFKALLTPSKETVSL